MLEVLLLVGLDIALYFLWGLEAMMLFSLGFIWNWAATQELEYVLENRRYRFSMMKLVYNLHDIFQRPFKKLPRVFRIIAKIFPAGIFWALVIHSVGSKMPWWATFLGSAVFELTQLDMYFQKSEPPALPPEDNQEQVP